MSEQARHLRSLPSDHDPFDGKSPPADIDAEAALLSAVLLDPAAMPKVADILRAEQFFSGAHNRIFGAAFDLYERREPIDAQTVATWLHTRQRLTEVGGIAYIGSILDSSPVVANVRSYAIAVHEFWRRRKVIHACRLAVGTGLGAVPDVQRYCDDVTKTIALISQQNPSAPSETTWQVLTRILNKALDDEPAEDPSRKRDRGFPTKLHTLDTFFDGYRAGAKTTVAATTGVGKTAFAIQAATTVAEMGGGVIFWTMEMRKEELLRRALAAKSGVASEKIKKRDLSRSDATALIEAANWLNKLPLYFEEKARPTIEEVRARTAAIIERAWLVDRVRVVLVIVDYIQRMAPSRDVRDRPQHEQIAHATTGTKTMAQELEVAVLELAQAKEAEKRRGKKYRPKAEDCVADSKKIAKECDEFLLLIPAEDDHPENPDLDVTIWMPKQRDGRRGEADVVFHRNVYRFEDMNDPMRCGSRVYVDRTPEPPPGRFEDDNVGTSPLTEGL